jgi:hypothetical protein
MLQRALEGDRSNKMATKIVRKAASTKKKIIVKWITTHVRISDDLNGAVVSNADC